MGVVKEIPYSTVCIKYSGVRTRMTGTDSTGMVLCFYTVTKALQDYKLYRYRHSDRCINTSVTQIQDRPLGTNFISIKLR
jgi:hypothetical protein